MNHSFLDQYSDRDSFIHHLDPRTKFLGTMLFILAVSLTPPGRWLALVIYFILTLTLILLSRVPVIYILKRSLVIVPFVLLMAIFIPFFHQDKTGGSYNVWLWQVPASGLLVMGSILGKAWLSILSLILLSATTRMTSLLRGLEQLHLPRVMVMLLSFMYRYIFILTDEVMRMKQAGDSRSAGGSRLWHIRTIGNMTGMLFVRSYERGERVYAAMLSRGFDGQSRTLYQLNFRPADAFFGVCLGLTIIAGALLGQI